MNGIIQFLQQIYTLLCQVQEIVKANNQFAQSMEHRIIKIEQSLDFEIPQVNQVQEEDFAIPSAGEVQIPEV